MTFDRVGVWHLFIKILGVEQKESVRGGLGKGSSVSCPGQR